MQQWKLQELNIFIPEEPVDDKLLPKSLSSVDTLLQACTCQVVVDEDIELKSKMKRKNEWDKSPKLEYKTKKKAIIKTKRLCHIDTYMTQIQSEGNKRHSTRKSHFHYALGLSTYVTPIIKRKKIVTKSIKEES